MKHFNFRADLCHIVSSGKSLTLMIHNIGACTRYTFFLSWQCCGGGGAYDIDFSQLYIFLVPEKCTFAPPLLCANNIYEFACCWGITVPLRSAYQKNRPIYWHIVGIPDLMRKVVQR